MKGLDTERFNEIAAKVQDWMTVDDLVALCDHEEFWSLDFVENALADLKKVAVRRLVRMKRWQDDDGRPIELVSIVQRDVETNKSTRAYKQLALFEVDDFIQVIADRRERRDYFDGEIRRFVRIACDRFGEDVRDLLPFSDLGDDEG